MNTPNVVVHHDKIKQAAWDVLGFFDLPHGRTPGGFTTALIQAFDKADAANYARLAKVYPYHAHALSLISEFADGDQMLVRWANLIERHN